MTKFERDAAAAAAAVHARVLRQGAKDDDAAAVRLRALANRLARLDLWGAEAAEYNRDLAAMVSGANALELRADQALRRARRVERRIETGRSVLWCSCGVARAADGLPCRHCGDREPPTALDE